MNPMNTFNPRIPCHVHDRLNDEIIEWHTRWASPFLNDCVKRSDGFVAWDGLLVDGWSPIVRLGGH